MVNSEIAEHINRCFRRKALVRKQVHDEASKKAVGKKYIAPILFMVLQDGAPADSSTRYESKNVLAEDGKSTVLHYLMYTRNIFERDKKIELLFYYGADPERRTYECDGTMEQHTSEDGADSYGCGDTPLMMACAAEHYDAVKVLLEHGVDVNAVDHYGKTALVYVIQSNDSISDEAIQVKIVKLLLEYGADPFVNGLYNGTALEEAQVNEKDQIEQILLEYQ